MQDLHHLSHKKTSFHDLPAELRNNIYVKSGLPLGKTFLIKCKNDMRKSDQPCSDPSRRQRRIIRTRARGSTVIRHNHRPYRVAIKEVYDLHLMLVCKLINVEVTSMIYGSNYFTFRNHHALIDFKAATRTNFALLRNVALQWMGLNSSHAKMLHKLIPLANPAQIVMDIDYIVNEAWPCNHLWSLRPQVAPAETIPLSLSGRESFDF